MIFIVLGLSALIAGLKMAASTAGKFVSALCAFRGTSARLNLGYAPSCAILQTRNYAARKGTREKARKKKVKVEVKKLDFIPHKERGIKNVILPIEKIREDDSWKQELPDDNVWIGKFHKWRVYSFEEAIQFHKETHQFGMLDAPDAFVTAFIELDMKGPKPSRPVTRFSRIVYAPHPYDHGENRSVAVFCKSPEMQKEAKEAGATVVGGAELISNVQSGQLPMADYDYVIAHPNIMAELVVIKGLLKKKFPTPTTGSLTADVPASVRKFLKGMKYSGHPHERQSLFGISEVTFGRLNMDTQKLKENLAAIIDDINANRPKRPGPFITRIRIKSLPSRERFKIDHQLFEKNKLTEDNDDDDDDEDEGVAARA